MDYFSKLLRTGTQASPKQTVDHALEFHKSWSVVKETLTHPDERQLARGIKATEVPNALKSMVDCLVWESTRTEEGATGACLEYLLKNDVLGTLVRLSEPDRPSGIQAEVLRTVQNLVVLLDEQFLVHSVVHRAVLRLLKTCVGDDIQEQLDGRNRVMGAAGTAVRTAPSEYEEDLVDLLCLLCSRIRTFRELLMIFFYDKHWYQTEHLPAVIEEDEDDDEEEEDTKSPNESLTQRSPSPTPSQETVTSAPASSAAKKPEYEFLLFNYLLRFVHREGKIGEFARAGLLFLMDVAMSPSVPINRLAGNDITPSSSSSTLTQSQSQTTISDPVADAALALAEYILDGDFCEVLAAGLGAVYSLLPSKLEIDTAFSDSEEKGKGNTSSNSNGSNMRIGGTGPLSEEEKDKLELDKERKKEMGVEFSENPEFKSRLDHFVKLLEFLQDVLRRNVSEGKDEDNVDPSSFVGSAIAQSILDAVRRIFLENVLYTSILECSDTDGSAVAVLSYIDVIVRTLHDEQFAEMIIDFLVTEDDTELIRKRPHIRSTLLLGGKKQEQHNHQQQQQQQQSSSSGSGSHARAMKMSRRKSSAMMLLEMEAPDARRQSEYLTSTGRYTLKDLLLTNLRSNSHATVAASLQLMQSLVSQHCQISIERLFLYSTEVLPHGRIEDLNTSSNVDDDDDDETFVYPGAGDSSVGQSVQSGPDFVAPVPEMTLSMHERTMGLFFSLVTHIDPTHRQGAFSTGYENYLEDALSSLTSHSCYFYSRGPAKHSLDLNDPILSLVLQSLRKFYSNSPELNITLTGFLSSIALCPDRSLKGWLLFEPDVDQSSEDHTDSSLTPLFAEDEDDRSVDYHVAERLASRDVGFPVPNSTRPPPVIYAILHGLVESLDKFRNMIENFDIFLSERRQGLLFSENLTDALSLTFDLSTNVPSFAPDLRGESSSSSTRTRPIESTPVKTKPKQKSSSPWTSFLSPRKSRPGTRTPSTPPEPTPPPLPKVNTIDASPFGSHYRKTTNISVEPLIAPLPTSGSWAPPESRTFGIDEDDVFGYGSAWNESNKDLSFAIPPAKVESKQVLKRITLSQLLDNVVILEESIKEFTAIIHARRTLGVDPVRLL